MPGSVNCKNAAIRKSSFPRARSSCENCRLAANDPDNTVWSKEKGEKDSRERKRNEELIARALENEEREQKAREE